MTGGGDWLCLSVVLEVHQPKLDKQEKGLLQLMGQGCLTCLRNENSGDFALFKNNLDIFLVTIPDQPTTPGLVRAAVTNSLVDQVPLCDSVDF